MVRMVTVGLLSHYHAGYMLEQYKTLRKLAEEQNGELTMRTDREYAWILSIKRKGLFPHINTKIFSFHNCSQARMSRNQQIFAENKLTGVLCWISYLQTRTSGIAKLFVCGLRKQYLHRASETRN